MVDIPPTSVMLLLAPFSGADLATRKLSRWRLRVGIVTTAIVWSPEGGASPIYGAGEGSLGPGRVSFPAGRGGRRAAGHCFGP